MTPSSAILRARDLTKRYGTNTVLDRVSLDIFPGRVHVLFGENGAGKSTLISILAGANVPNEGSIAIGDHHGTFESVGESRAQGVRAVFQEFSLVPQLSVAENIVLGEEPVNGARLLSKGIARTIARALIHDLGFDLDPDVRVDSLPRGKQQMVEICKAFAKSPRVLILDEPTASLSEHDAKALFALVERLKTQGTAIIYITHRTHEIPLLGDDVSVLRDGRLIATVPADTPERRLIELMTGRTIADIYPTPRTELGEVRLAVRGLSLASAPGTVSVQGIDFEVRAGEILGIAGLVGCGKSELAQACFGLKDVADGEIVVDGVAMRPLHPSDAIRKGLWYSPPDRKREGLMLGRSARENMALSAVTWGSTRGFWLRPRREDALLQEVSRRVEFPADRLDEPVGNFSGGNQQKVLVAKGMAQPIRVYVFDEPTVGVDMGARPAIYRYFAELGAAGAAILLVSSDLTELLGLSHRLLVMKNGYVAGQFARDAFDEHQILEQFF